MGYQAVAFVLLLSTHTHTHTLRMSKKNCLFCIFILNVYECNSYIGEVFSDQQFTFLFDLHRTYPRSYKLHRKNDRISFTCCAGPINNNDTEIPTTKSRSNTITGKMDGHTQQRNTPKKPELGADAKRT